MRYSKIGKYTMEMYATDKYINSYFIKNKTHLIFKVKFINDISRWFNI